MKNKSNQVDREDRFQVEENNPVQLELLIRRMGLDARRYNIEIIIKQVHDIKEMIKKQNECLRTMQGTILSLDLSQVQKRKLKGTHNVQ